MTDKAFETPQTLSSAETVNPSGTNAPEESVGVFSGYEVKGRLGQGTFGYVYKVNRLSDNKLFAIKRLKVKPLESVLNRFRQEAMILQRFPHSALVGFHDICFPVDEPPYIVLDYISGLSSLGHQEESTNLENYLKTHSLSVRESLLLIAEIAAALEAPHAVGVIHRDIKPANILLTDPLADSELPFHPVLTDFGVAFFPDNDEITKEVLAVGTFLYMAPEQFRRRRSVPPDGLSDIYSLGCILSLLLTKQHPFEGESDERSLFARKTIDGASQPSLLAPGLPKVVDDLCLSMLEPERIGRPDAVKLQSRIAEILENEVQTVDYPNEVSESILNATTKALGVFLQNSRKENALSTLRSDLVVEVMIRMTIAWEQIVGPNTYLEVVLARFRGNKFEHFSFAMPPTAIPNDHMKLFFGADTSFARAIETQSLIVVSDCETEAQKSPTDRKFAPTPGGDIHNKGSLITYPVLSADGTQEITDVVSVTVRTPGFFIAESRESYITIFRPFAHQLRLANMILRLAGKFKN